jgi:hypothetical protein
LHGKDASPTERNVRPRQLLALAWLGLGLATRPAFAQVEPADAQLAQAKEKFRQGVARLNAGDTAGALDEFLGSRELHASGRNTVNAAICLERLGRYDEALELYEEVVAKFTADLDQDDRDSLAPVMTSLGAKLGYLELWANVDGDVFVGGRARGRLPLRTALRVLPGKQAIRIEKQGYLPFEASMELPAGQTQRVRAQLELVGPRPIAGLNGAAISKDSARAGAATGGVRRTVGWTLGAAGGAQLGVAAYFGVRAIQLHGDNNEGDAGRAADVSTILGATGLATTGVAIYLLLSSSSNQRATATNVSLFGLSGLSVSGSF